MKSSDFFIFWNFAVCLGQLYAFNPADVVVRNFFSMTIDMSQWHSNLTSEFSGGKNLQLLMLFTVVVPEGVLFTQPCVNSENSWFEKTWQL